MPISYIIRFAIFTIFGLLLMASEVYVSKVLLSPTLGLTRSQQIFCFLMFVAQGTAIGVWGVIFVLTLPFYL